MAENKSTRSHVSGFVKRLKENRAQKVVIFTVAKQKFILPLVSTFTTAVVASGVGKQNILVLFETNDRAHPTITGIIESPTWPQMVAAREGQGFDAIKALHSKKESA